MAPLSNHYPTQTTLLRFSALLLIISITTMIQPSSATARRWLAAADHQNSELPVGFPFEYHRGELLTGKLSINILWYGTFNPAQRAIITDFISSLSASPNSQHTPSVAAWWASLSKYYYQTTKSADNPSSTSLPIVSVGNQTFDAGCSFGKSLTAAQIQALASRTQEAGAAAANSVSVVLTSSDVAVSRFCMSSCGTHGVVSNSKSTYIWVGNPETQCPGSCAWPFHRPIYGPQSPPLVAPNNDVGVDGMVINLASLLAGTVTNPFGNGYFQGPKEAPVEAASACPGVYGRGAYPGYAGDLMVDQASGASYNANGASGRKYLLPALFDPATSTCSTLV